MQHRLCKKYLKRKTIEKLIKFEGVSQRFTMQTIKMLLHKVMVKELIMMKIIINHLKTTKKKIRLMEKRKTSKYLMKKWRGRIKCKTISRQLLMKQ